MALFAKTKTIRQRALALSQGYPALLAEADRVAAVVAAGVHGRRRAGAGETFWQYRNYQTTDAATQIDWRRSARGDQVFVRDNEWEAANSIYLWTDVRPGMAWGSARDLPTKADRGRVLSLATANLLMKAGERCALAGLQDRARSGRVGYERLAERMMTGTAPGPEALEANIPAHSKFLIVSDFYENLSAWQERLAQLSGRPTSGVILQIADPAEEDFPFTGRLDLRRPGGGQGGFLLGRAETAQEAYQAKLAAHHDAMAQTARRLGWTFIRHRTDTPATQALNAIYQALAGEI
jgi:uncharacterized protein (DUF58 family)